MINRTLPFLGKGIKFPFQIDPITGGVAMSEANVDTIPTAVSVLPDRLTISSGALNRQNHIAESMAHIMQTVVGERDMLPQFGSNASNIINDPNQDFAKMEYETWVQIAVARWEKRVVLKVPENFNWTDDTGIIDEGVALCSISPTITSTQVPGNLVAPFVTPRDARNQEYKLGQTDAEGHDWTSRYYGQPAYEENGERFLMPVDRPPLLPQADDIFEPVRYGDNWWTISGRLYGDVRFGDYIAEFWIDDQAEAGASADALDVTNELEPGTILRCPSKARILTQLAA